MADLSRYPDRKYLKRRETPGNEGWQFVTEKRGFEERQWFGDAQYGGPDESYAAAIAHRTEFLTVARELGIADESGLLRDRSLPLLLSLSPRNNSGIIGVNRSSRARKGRKKREEHWVANYKKDDGDQEQEKFSINGLGEKEALFRAVEFRRNYVKGVRETLSEPIYCERVDNHITELDDILDYISELEDASDVFFFLGTLNNPLLDSTQKQEMLNIRIGQRRFRRLVLDFWQHQCVVTGARVLLTAAHIKPWRDADATERLDVFNGLALSPVYDKAFDEGFISFDSDGSILVSDSFAENMTDLCVSGDEQIHDLDDRHQHYLEYHRQTIFQGCSKSRLTNR